MLDGVASTQFVVLVRVGGRQSGDSLGVSESDGVCRRSGGLRWGPCKRSRGVDLDGVSSR